MRSRVCPFDRGSFRVLHTLNMPMWNSHILRPHSKLHVLLILICIIQVNYLLKYYLLTENFRRIFFSSLIPVAVTRRGKLLLVPGGAGMRISRSSRESSLRNKKKVKHLGFEEFSNYLKHFKVRDCSEWRPWHLPLSRGKFLSLHSRKVGYFTSVSSYSNIIAYFLIWKFGQSTELLWTTPKDESKRGQLGNRISHYYTHFVKKQPYSVHSWFHYKGYIYF